MKKNKKKNSAYLWWRVFELTCLFIVGIVWGYTIATPTENKVGNVLLIVSTVLVLISTITTLTVDVLNRGEKDD